MAGEGYLEKIEEKTGKTAKDFAALAKAKGYDDATKAGVIMGWLKEDFALGHGHAMALMHAIKPALPAARGKT